MIRIIVRTMDGSFACHLGGPGTPAELSFKTFDIDAPELETFLREDVGRNNSGVSRSAIGIEVLDVRPSPAPKDGGADHG